MLHGQSTLRGITRQFAFPVVIASPDGQRMTGQVQFGSIYGTGRFFRLLGKHVMNDHSVLDTVLDAGMSGPGRLNSGPCRRTNR